MKLFLSKKKKRFGHFNDLKNGERNGRTLISIPNICASKHKFLPELLVNLLQLGRYLMLYQEANLLEVQDVKWTHA